jgi:hypothetical protein
LALPGFFLLALLGPPSFGGFLGYLSSTRGRELVAPGTTAFQATTPPELACRLSCLFGFSVRW